MPFSLCYAKLFALYQKKFQAFVCVYLMRTSSFLWSLKRPIPPISCYIRVFVVFCPLQRRPEPRGLETYGQREYRKNCKTKNPFTVNVLSICQVFLKNGFGFDVSACCVQWGSWQRDGQWLSQATGPCISTLRQTNKGFHIIPPFPRSR